MKRRLLYFFIIIVVCVTAVFTYGYFTSYEYSLNTRQKLAKIATGDIHVAVVLKNNAPASFTAGVEVALIEENTKGFALQLDGKTVLRKLVLHYVGENDKISGVVNNHDIVAVIGFIGSVPAVEASISYENHGILFLSTSATDQRLTNHDLKYTFSIIPIDRNYAKKLVDFSEQQQYRRVTYLYARQGGYGINLCNMFSSFLLGKHITIVGSHSFDTTENDHRELIYEMLKTETDAILLGAVGEPAARVIYQLRSLGINKPILGSDGLDNPKIWEMSGEKAFDTYVASVYIDNPYLKNKNTYSEFHDQFVKKNNRPPDYLARQGYESVKILAAAFRKSNSTVPITVAATLKYGFDQAFGGYNFDTLGRITNKDILMKVMDKGSFYDVTERVK